LKQDLKVCLVSNFFVPSFLRQVRLIDESVKPGYVE